jgi:hypothetical protein
VNSRNKEDEKRTNSWEEDGPSSGLPPPPKSRLVQEIGGASGDTKVSVPDTQLLCAPKDGWCWLGLHNCRWSRGRTLHPAATTSTKSGRQDTLLNLLKGELEPLMRVTFEFRTTRNGIKVVTKHMVDYLALMTILTLVRYHTAPSIQNHWNRWRSSSVSCQGTPLLRHLGYSIISVRQMTATLPKPQDGLQTYSAPLTGSTIWVRFPAGAGNFSLHRRVQNGSEAHPASYPMGTVDSFPGNKAAGAWSWPLTSISCRGQEWVELYLHSPNTPSRHGAQLSTGTALPSPYFTFASWIRDLIALVLPVLMVAKCEIWVPWLIFADDSTLFKILLCEFLVTTACRVLGLRLKEETSRYGW